MNECIDLGGHTLKIKYNEYRICGHHYHWGKQLRISVDNLKEARKNCREEIYGRGRKWFISGLGEARVVPSNWITLRCPLWVTRGRITRSGFTSLWQRLSPHRGGPCRMRAVRPGGAWWGGGPRSTPTPEGEHHVNACDIWTINQSIYFKDRHDSLKIFFYEFSSLRFPQNLTTNNTKTYCSR